MNKKLIAFITCSLLLITMSTTVFASSFSSSKKTSNQTTSQASNYRGCGNGYMQFCYSLMRDSNGNFVDRNTFISNLENSITKGDINSKDKDSIINMYDYCTQNNTQQNNRGGCCNNSFNKQ